MRSLIFATLLAAGCGGSMFSQRIDAYRATSSSLDAAVDAHGKAAPAATPSACAAAMADYAQKAGALVDQMQSMSGGMDQCMSSLGRPDQADLAAGCSAIRSELDAHARSGCAAQDPAAELGRHVAAMKSHTLQEMERLGQMESMGNGAGSSMMGGLQGCH